MERASFRQVISAVGRWSCDQMRTFVVKALTTGLSAQQTLVQRVANVWFLPPSCTKLPAKVLFFRMSASGWERSLNDFYTDGSLGPKTPF